MAIENHQFFRRDTFAFMVRFPLSCSFSGVVNSFSPPWSCTSLVWFQKHVKPLGKPEISNLLPAMILTRFQPFNLRGETGWLSTLRDRRPGHGGGVDGVMGWNTRHLGMMGFAISSSLKHDNSIILHIRIYKACYQVNFKTNGRYSDDSSL